MTKINSYSLLLCLLFFLMSCDVYMHPPVNQREARIGETKKQESSILKGILPKKKIVVGVYKFRDQTGQYKSTENGSSWSTAVPQGTTSILVKSLEDSKWFSPIERENVSNLLNERQIIRSTRKEYTGKDQTSIPPLLFAGVLLEGGIISYDSNIITGGAGLRYFGAGGSSQYRQDRITVYLRAVSTSNGKVLKTVYTSKTILSQSLSGSLFRYVSLKRLLEVETGVTKNEPVQLAVKEAIDKAVESLIVEGIIDGLWETKKGKESVDIVQKRYEKENEVAQEIDLYNRKLEDKRGKAAFSIQGVGSRMHGDYRDPQDGIGGGISMDIFLKNPRFSISTEVAYFPLENLEIFKEDCISASANLNWYIVPFDRITPFLYGGVGAISPTEDIKAKFKFQYGGGLEYLVKPNIGIRVFAEQNFLTTDEFDGMIQGERDDGYFRAGLQLTFYFGSKYKSFSKR